MNTTDEWVDEWMNEWISHFGFAYMMSAVMLHKTFQLFRSCTNNKLVSSRIHKNFGGKYFDWVLLPKNLSETINFTIQIIWENQFRILFIL